MRSLLIIAPAAILIALCSARLGATAAHGHEQEARDEDRARAAVEKGEILPLEQVLAGLRTEVSGEISQIELEKEGGVWVYEFKIISPRGHMVEVYADAKTGKLIKKKGD